MIDAQEMFELRGKAGQIEDRMYERLCEMFGDGIIEDTSTDWYDSSIELYASSDLVPTAPQVDEMLSWGFSRGWINFKDETQIYFTKGHTSERHKRSYSKYPMEPRRAKLPEEQRNDFAEALEILRSIEFTTVVAAKCPVCLGFEMPHGEQSRHHKKDCKLAALLKRNPASPPQSHGESSQGDSH